MNPAGVVNADGATIEACFGPCRYRALTHTRVGDGSGESNRPGEGTGRRTSCQGTGPSATASPPCSSRPSSRSRDTPASSTARRAGPASGPPRAADATTGTRNEPGRRRTSGSARSEKIGGAPSIGRITPGRGQASPHPPEPERLQRLRRSVPPHVRGRARKLTSIRFRYACGKAQARRVIIVKQPVIVNRRQHSPFVSSRYTSLFEAWRRAERQLATGRRQRVGARLGRQQQLLQVTHRGV